MRCFVFEHTVLYVVNDVNVESDHFLLVSLKTTFKTLKLWEKIKHSL